MELGIMHSAGSGVPTTTSSHMPGMLSSPAESPSAAKLPDGCLPPYVVVGAPRAQVMTDEQLETLRRQISVYATICQQLVEMHKATMAQQNAISGSRFGQSSSCDSGLYSLGQKFASRQRWTPSQTQLQILEKLFQQGNGTPTKQRIKEISTELSQYGQISETNVYNWFQNRRARTKRKQQLGGLNNGESEFDTDIDSQEEKRVRAGKELHINSFNYQTSSEKWEQVENQQLNAAQNGLQPSQRQTAIENCASKSDAAILDIKPNSVRASFSQGEGHVEMTSGNIEAMRLLQNVKGYSTAE